MLFDTHVVIWEIKGIDEPTKNEEVIASMGLVDNLLQTSCRLHISTVTIAEALIGLDQHEHDDFYAELKTSFNLHSFTPEVARTTAEIIQFSRPEMEALIDELQKNRILAARRIVYNDMKIIGTATHKKINTICTNDKKMHKLAAPFVPNILHPTELNELLLNHPDSFTTEKS